MRRFVPWLAVLLVGATARAQDAELERRLNDLERKVRDQERTIGEQRARIDRLTSISTAGEPDPARLEAAVDRYLEEKGEDGGLLGLSDLDLRGVFKDGFRWTTANEEHQLELGGRLQVDGLFHAGEDDPLTSTFAIRRARIHAAGYLYKYYHWKVEADFAGAAGTLQDGWLDVRTIDEAQLQVGQFKVPYGLEELTSSRYVKLIERSMVTNFIAPSRQIGGMVHGKLWDDRIQYSIGLFNGNGRNTRDNNDEKEVAGRLVLEPFRDSDNTWIQGIHLGGAFTYGKPEAALGGGGPRTAVGTRFFTYRAGTVSEEERIRWGVEAAWHVGPFGVSGEFLERVEDLGIPTAPATVEGRARIRGWYVTANYFLTGEKTSFKRVKPRNPFDPLADESGPGAWELVARVGEVLTDEDVEPFITGADRAAQFEAGINWYPSSMLRFSLNYVHADFGDSVFGGERGEDSLLFRFQIEF